LLDVGLPPVEIPLALFAFNVGIELGQLLIIANVFGAMVIAQRVELPAVAQERFRATSAQAIGIIAAYWLIERLAGYWT
jgi:hypothetical protein